MHDAPHQRVQRRQGGLECIPRFFNGSCEAWDGTCPARTESCRRRFGAGPKKAEIASLEGWLILVFGDALATQDGLTRLRRANHRLA